MLRTNYVVPFMGFDGDSGCPYPKQFTQLTLAAYQAIKKDPIVQLVVLYTVLFGQPPSLDVLCEPLTAAELKTGKELVNKACQIWGVNPDDPKIRETAIRNTYRIFLGREPDQGGWKYWNNDWSKHKCYTPNIILETLFWCYTPTSEAAVAANKIMEIVQNYEQANNPIEYCKQYYLNQSIQQTPVETQTPTTDQVYNQQYYDQQYYDQQNQGSNDLLFLGALAGLGILAVMMAKGD